LKVLEEAGHTDEEEDKVSEFSDKQKDVENILYENKIYKFSKKNNCFTYYWMVIVDQEIHHYKEPLKKTLIKISNINGCFVKENGSETKKGDKYYSFSIIYGGKQVTYYTKDRQEAKVWTKNIREAIGYKNFFDFYEIIDEVSMGKELYNENWN